MPEVGQGHHHAWKQVVDQFHQLSWLIKESRAHPIAIQADMEYCHQRSRFGTSEEVG